MTWKFSEGITKISVNAARTTAYSFRKNIEYIEKANSYYSTHMWKTVMAIFEENLRDHLYGKTQEETRLTNTTTIKLNTVLLRHSQN